jgi:hypothetical protein
MYFKLNVSPAVASFCEDGNGPPGSIKILEFLDQITDCWLLKMGMRYGISYLAN